MTSLVSNSVISPERSRDSRRRRKKKIQSQINGGELDYDLTKSKWRSESEQKLYSSKLLRAIPRFDSPATASKRSKAVREAADRVLAMTAKGKTRWSRAILKDRLKLSFMKRKRLRATSTAGNGRSRKRLLSSSRLNVVGLKGKNLPVVQKKTRVLGRLVPGCKKQTLQVILEEATDYIAALEMQVRAMTALDNLLTGPTSSANHT